MLHIKKVHLNDSRLQTWLLSNIGTAFNMQPGTIIGSLKFRFPCKILINEAPVNSINQFHIQVYEGGGKIEQNRL